MTKYYSPSINGFTDKPGTDGLEIGVNKWLALLDEVYSGRELYCNNGEPDTRAFAPTAEQVAQAVEQKKASLMAEATATIAPLQDAMDLDIAMDDEMVQLAAWKKYRVLLMRVDAAAPVWPTVPVV